MSQFLFSCSGILFQFFILLFIVAIQWDQTIGFASFHYNYASRSVVPLLHGNKLNKRSLVQLYYEDDNNNNKDDEEEVDDWRDFRAKLVMQEQSTQVSPTSDNFLSSSTCTNSWAYESGTMIERGSVIMSKPRSVVAKEGNDNNDNNYYSLSSSYGGLYQQYFHKCVMLVVEHDPSGFTKGIILNRPSDLQVPDTVLTDEIISDPIMQKNQKVVTWNIWYGGNLGSFDSESPEFTCLHVLKSDIAKKLSKPIMQNLQSISLSGARYLVANGHADPNDFWVFCGFAIWKPGQLMDECLERQEWYMVAANSKSLWQDIYFKKSFSYPSTSFDFGIQIWNTMLHKIGKQQQYSNPATTITTKREEFEDSMLQEWTKQHLTMNECSPAKAQRHYKSSSSSSSSSYSRLLRLPVCGELLSAKRPFLLEQQEFHKSIILIVDIYNDSNDNGATVVVGVMLNHASAFTEPLLNYNKIKKAQQQEDDDDDYYYILRYGGPFGDSGDNKNKNTKAIHWFHCLDTLKQANIGKPVGNNSKIDNNNGFWTCSAQQAEFAIQQGLATTRDFLVTEGVYVWDSNDLLHELQNEEKWDIVHNMKQECNYINQILSYQVATTSKNSISNNLKWSNVAWQSTKKYHDDDDNDDDTESVGQGNDDNNEALADQAQRYWAEAFLLEQNEGEEKEMGEEK